MKTDANSIEQNNNIINDTCNIIDSAQNYVFQQINTTLVKRNWLIGKRIYEEELKEKDRANYGLEIIKTLSNELAKIYGKGFTKTNLYKFLQFYKIFPNIFHTPCGKSYNIVDAVSQQSRNVLSWSHYRFLIQVNDDKARNWYEQESINEVWSARTLARNISSQYYYRMLKTHNDKLIKQEMKNKIEKYEDPKLEFIKNPVIMEFLGIPKVDNLYETNLETSIINNLQNFLIELGKGYAFVGRQQHIKTEKQDYYIDLVFYNYILKCFVLIDLKTEKITHQDVGQMDMYVRMYDEFKKGKDDNPTIGILLCSETDDDIARFSILNDNKQLYEAKYLLYMPTKEELKREIETQKALFYLEKENKTFT